MAEGRALPRARQFFEPRQRSAGGWNERSTCTREWEAAYRRRSLGFYDWYAVVAVWFLCALWPFSRLVHAWSVPVDHLRRSPIPYRGRVARPSAAALRSQKAE